MLTHNNKLRGHPLVQILISEETVGGYTKRQIERPSTCIQSIIETFTLGDSTFSLGQQQSSTLLLVSAAIFSQNEVIEVEHRCDCRMLPIKIGAHYTGRNQATSAIAIFNEGSLIFSMKTVVRTLVQIPVNFLHNTRQIS